MNLIDMIQASGQQEKIANALAAKFGMDSTQANAVMAQVMGALGGGIAQNAREQGGVEDLMNAIQKGNHAQYVEQPETALNATEEGNAILGHILGSKEESRNVAAQVEQSSGVSSAIVKQMLPIIATMAMGAISKKAFGGQSGGMLGTAMKAGALGGLMKMLDFDKDGSPIDDIMKIVGGIRK